MVAVDVHILIMNEDSSRTAYEALRHLIRRICQLLCPDLGTQHLAFSPTPEELEGCVRAGQWQSSNPRHRRQQVDLAQSIASQIATDRGFVASTTTVTVLGHIGRRAFTIRTSRPTCASAYVRSLARICRPKSSMS